MKSLRIALAAAALTASGCMGDTFTTDDGHDAASFEAAVEAGPLDAVPPEAGADPDAGQEPDACIMQTFYLDLDGDGWGGTDTAVACVPPSGSWVTKGGDCDDSNDAVHPGQTAFFTTPYTPTGKTTLSFDYDCDGSETESGASPKGNCHVVLLSCVGDGYVAVTPARGGNADDYCGSDLSVACSGLPCSAGNPQAAAPIGCR